MFEHLDWDSKFFGFKVAKLYQNILKETDFIYTLNTLKENEYKLIYWFIDPNNKLCNTLARNYKGYLADKKITYTLKLNTEKASLIDDAIDEFLEYNATPDMVELALATGEYSRFKRDKNISENKFIELYKLWF